MKEKSIWVLTSCQQDCQLVTLECDPFCEDANWLYQPMSLPIIFDRLGTFCHWLSGCPPTDYTIWKRTVEKSQINAPHATWWAYTMQFVTGCQKAGQLIIPLPPQVSCSTIVQLSSINGSGKWMFVTFKFSRFNCIPLPIHLIPPFFVYMYTISVTHFSHVKLNFKDNFFGLLLYVFYLLKSLLENKWNSPHDPLKIDKS